MLNKKVNIIIFITFIFLLIALLFVFINNNFNTNNKNDDNKNTIENSKSSSMNLEDLNIDQLIEFRDKLIDKNLEDTLDSQHLKNSILTSDWGLVTYINKTYSNLTEKEKLIKQIKIIEYLNSINDRMDPSGSFFEGANEMYQISQYLIQKGKDPIYFNSYESLNFLINNLQDVCNFVDYDAENVVYSIDPSVNPNLSEEQKTSLIKDLKNIYLKGNLNERMKKAIKELLAYNGIDIN